MKPTYKYSIDNLEIVVFDKCFLEKTIKAIFAVTMSIPQWSAEKGNRRALDSQFHLSADFMLNEIKRDEPFRKMEELVNITFPNEKLKPYRAHCNLTRFGDMTLPHMDCDVKKRDVTAIYYANAKWPRTWGGETIYYNKRKDTVLALNPKPGRIVLFRGAIEHRNGVPSRDCEEPRFSFAYKFRQ